MHGTKIKYARAALALSLGCGFAATAFGKEFDDSTVTRFDVSSNPVIRRETGLMHYSSDPSVEEITDTHGNRLLVMVSSSDLENRNDAGNWPMNQTFLYATVNSQQGNPIATTWFDHGPVLSEWNFGWAKGDNHLWAPDITYYSSTNDIWLYVPDKDKNNVFRIGMAHAAVADGLYSNAGFKAETNFMTIANSVFGSTPSPGTAFDPGVFSDEVVVTGRRTFMVYADREYGNGSGNNLSIAEIMSDHKSASYLGKIRISGPLANYNGLTRYMEGPDIFAMQMPGRGGRIFYYLVFTTNVEGGTDDTGYIGYAMCSDQEFHASWNAPANCWKFKGWIFRNMRTGRSNHASLINYGKRYVFYHRSPPVCCPERSRARQVAVKEFEVIDHPGFDDDGEIVGVTHPTGSQNVNDSTLYGSLDGLSDTFQPAFINVQDKDTSTISSTIEFTGLKNTTNVTLSNRKQKLYYYVQADPGMNMKVEHPGGVYRFGMDLQSPPLKHIVGNTWAIVMDYGGFDLQPGQTFENFFVQLRITGNPEANDFSRALGNFVTPTTRVALYDANDQLLAGEAPNTVANMDFFKVLRTEHKDLQSQFTYLTTSYSNPDVGINNQYLMTGSQSQAWYLDPVNSFENIQGLPPLSVTDQQNAFRIRCKWTNFYMTANDVNRGTRSQPSFWVLSQALRTVPQWWATQIWIREPVGNGSFRLRSAWIPGPDKNSDPVAIYLTLQAASSAGKQDVYVQPLSVNLDRQKWIIE